MVIDFPAASQQTAATAVKYPERFPGIDVGAKIAAAIDDLPPSGGTIDARKLSGVQTVGSQLLISKPNITVLLSSALTLKLTANINDDGVIKITASNVRFFCDGATITADRGLNDSYTHYWLVRADDALTAINHLIIRGCNFRLTVNGNTQKEKRIGAINLWAQNPDHGISDWEISENTISVAAPDLGTPQKWYGIYAEGREDVKNVSRTIHRGMIKRNSLTSCAGRNIQVFRADHIVIADNIVNDPGPKSVYGPTGIRIISSDNISVLNNQIYSNTAIAANCFYIGALDGVKGDESLNVVVTGNTCINKSRGYGLEIIGARNSIVSGNKFSSSSTIAARSYGIYVQDVKALSNMDNVILANKISGYRSYQIHLDAGSVRTIIADNELTAPENANQTMEDLSTSTALENTNSPQHP